MHCVPINRYPSQPPHTPTHSQSHIAPPATGEVYLTDAVRYATGCLITALLVPPILNEAEALRLGVASNLALVSVEQRQRAERQDMEARGERPDEEADKVGRGSKLGQALCVYDPVAAVWGHAAWGAGGAARRGCGQGGARGGGVQYCDARRTFMRTGQSGSPLAYAQTHTTTTTSCSAKTRWYGGGAAPAFHFPFRATCSAFTHEPRVTHSLLTLTSSCAITGTGWRRHCPEHPHFMFSQPTHPTGPQFTPTTSCCASTGWWRRCHLLPPRALPAWPTP